ncbi:MAG: DUF2490 domain-containing protein [Bacteroidales bacterium]|nr:DUF2490 domain-containing protein [Bacteroidales bacterium]
MKRTFLMLALLLPALGYAQSVELGGRASIGLDYKISKGFHVTLEQEIRADENFSSLNRLQTTLGVTYKPVSWLKLGVGYAYISPYKVGKELDDGTSYTGFWNPRHRGYADVTGYYRLGDFQFSLRERLQYTYNSDASMNIYQNNPNAWALKSRVGVKYKGWKKVEPSLSFEVRTALNDPWGYTSGSEQTNKSGKTYLAYTHTGYTHVYNNRYRVNLGADISLTKHHTLKPYVLLDSCGDYEIDTNGDGTRLFSAGYNDTFKASVGIGYVYSF